MIRKPKDGIDWLVVFTVCVMVIIAFTAAGCSFTNHAANYVQECEEEDINCRLERLEKLRKRELYQRQYQRTSEQIHGVGSVACGGTNITSTYTTCGQGNPHPWCAIKGSR